jgi:GNAT superfamily N-acetyltransferase
VITQDPSIARVTGVVELGDLMLIRDITESVAVNENVSALQTELEQKYNLKSLFLADMGKRNAIELHSIIVNKEEQGSGTGSKVMQEIIAYADANDKIVVLDPGLLDKKHGTTSQSRLRKFYKRFGFIDNKGRNKNYEFTNLMIRYPQTSESVNEGYKLQLERDTDMMVLNITDTSTGKRTEVRGKSGYETNNYDANDKLHQLLDKISKSANISELMNGEVVGINPKHPDGPSAAAATDTAFKK